LEVIGGKHGGRKMQRLDLLPEDLEDSEHMSGTMCYLCLRSLKQVKLRLSLPFDSQFRNSLHRQLKWELELDFV
jgi:hypothetical protein